MGKIVILKRKWYLLKNIHIFLINFHEYYAISKKKIARRPPIRPSPKLFFFEQGNGPEGPVASLTFSGGSTFYMKGSKKSQNYTHTLTNCTRDLKQEEGKAIRSCSYSTAARLDAADLKVAGDGTTWDREAGARCINTRGPPIWHSSPEVVEDLQTSARRSNRHRCTRLEGSPFDHGERRRARRSEEPPKRSRDAPQLQMWPHASQRIEISFFLVTKKSERRGTRTPALEPRSADSGFIHEDFRSSTRPHIRLRPPEHREAAESSGAAPDRAKIQRLSSGINARRHRGHTRKTYC
jgi:hypothetical protein